jgi:hypothetical protein
MSALRWAAVPVLAGVLSSHAALASAQEPPPVPVATPTPAQAPAPGADQPADGDEEHHDAPSTVYYVTTTTTTTTTNVNAPVTVVTAPIGDPVGGTFDRPAAGRLVVNLGRCARRTPLRPSFRVRRARVRLAENATLVVRLNGRRVASLRVPSAPRFRRRARPVALRVHLAPNGMLTIRRPSGRLMTMQGCSG